MIKQLIEVTQAKTVARTTLALFRCIAHTGLVLPLSNQASSDNAARNAQILALARLYFNQQVLGINGVTRLDI